VSRRTCAPLIDGTGSPTGDSHDTLGCDASVAPDARESGYKPELHCARGIDRRKEGILRAPNSQTHSNLVDNMHGGRASEEKKDQERDKGPVSRLQ